MIAAHTVETFPSRDVTLAYRRFGQAGATPLLFVHGLSYFSYDWVNVGSRLSPDREACAIDMRGFGDSTPSTASDYRVSTMADDLLALLDHLRWPRAIVFGHSMGGRSAAYLSTTHPDRVAGLVLVDYSPENAPVGSRRVATTVANAPEIFPSVEAAMSYFGADSHSPRSADAKARLIAYLRPVAGGYAIKRDGFFREQFRRQLATGERPPLDVDMWEILRRIDIPCLVVRGIASDMFNTETAGKVKAANSRITLVEVEAGHNVAGENPVGFLDAVRPFIASLERRQS